MSIIRFLFIFFVFGIISPLVTGQHSAFGQQAVYSASQLEKRCATGFTRYDRFKDADRLQERKPGGLPLCFEVAGQLHLELDRTLRAYSKALSEGFKSDGAELKQVRAYIEKLQDRLNKCGVWTCFSWDEPVLSNGARVGLDSIRNHAWQAALYVESNQPDEATKGFAHVKVLITEFGKRIDRLLDAGQKVDDPRKHPAYKRTMAEVERFEGLAKKSLDQVRGGRDQLVADVKVLAETSKKINDIMQQVSRVKRLSGDEDQIIEGMEKFKTRVDSFNADTAPGIRDVLKDFGGKYGTDRAGISESTRRIMGNNPLPGPREPSGLFTRLSTQLASIEQTCQGLCGQLVEMAKSNAETKATVAARREEAMTRAKRCLQLALSFSPENPEAIALGKSLGARAASADDALNAVLDAGEWEGHSTAFNGPGNADSLARSALAWLANDPGWSKGKKPLAVRINGNWVVAERDRRTRATLTFGLPIEAAFRRDDDKSAGRDIAWVYRLTMVTTKAEKAASWKLARVGSNRQMRASKISGGSGSSSGPNVLFKLILALALLASGILLAGPALAKKGGALDTLVAILKPLRPLIGVGTLAAGVIFLVFNLLSPLSDLLPQAAAIVAGLFLGLELLLKKPTKLATAGSEDDLKAKAGRNVDAAVQKTQDFLASQEEKIRGIEKFQVPLGIGCLVLALLHLVAAGATFF